MEPRYASTYPLSSKKALSAFLLATVQVLLSGVTTAQEWKPDSPVELIATNAPGGGSDRILRIFVKILGKHIPTPASVVNKPGGGGAIACNYLNQHPGDGHYLLLASRYSRLEHFSGIPQADPQ